MPDFLSEEQRLRTDFDIKHMVMIGDRGMISQMAIDAMRDTDGIGSITVLKNVSTHTLIDQG